MEMALGILVGVVMMAVIFSIVNKGQYPYSYIVAYSFEKKDGGSGMGSMQLNRLKKIKGASEVDSVRSFIEKENGFEKVAIINWIKI